MNYVQDVLAGNAGPLNDSTPSDSIAPERSFGDDPTALCRDGTYSYSANRQGTCSHDGGVATWFP
jgi:hypothetical protein